MNSLFLSVRVASKFSSRYQVFFAILILFFTFGAARTQAQTSNEFFTTSYSGPIPGGPTASPQTARLLLNSNNPTGNTIGTTNINVSVTASLSNQQYTGVGTGTGNPVVMFGATNVNGTGGPTAAPVFGPMNTVGSGANGQFSNTPSGTAQGFTVGVNQAFDMYTSIRQWATGPAPATNSRVYMADLTLTFSSPVTNPRVHFMGIGGTTGTGLGFSSEFTLITPGLTLTKIRGNTDLAVTTTEVNNANATINASCSNNAACGTVRVNGSNITTVTFQVFIRGDGGVAAWSTGTSHDGDQFLISASLPESYNQSGNVFNDIDGSGTINGTGISMPNGSQLYATLIDPSDNSVMGSIPVNPDGTYSFNGIPGGGVDYIVEISTTQGTALSPAPAVDLPAGWNSVGENLGSGAGNDGLPDLALGLTINTANVTDANFGINMSPTAADVTIAGRVIDASGRGVRNAVVSLTDSQGMTRTARTNTFGYYRFDGVPAGEDYFLSAAAKRYQFEARLVSVNDAMSGLDFVALSFKRRIQR